MMKTIVLLLIMITAIINSQTKNNPRPWKGNAILGNGNICAVYSDDPRIMKDQSGRGIQHFYFKNYTADYISSAYITPAGLTTLPQRTGMKDYFSAYSETETGSDKLTSLCYLLPYDAVVISATSGGTQKEVSFNVVLRKPKTVTSENGKVFAQYPNGVTLALFASSGSFKADIKGDTLITLTGKTSGSKTDFIIAPAESRAQLNKTIAKIQKEKDLYSAAKKYWDGWFAKGKLPKKYTEEYKRNLYAARSASLNGEIPADMTGQFVTNNMPQLYPRDAMMCARVFMLSGHYEEAKQVIKFWGPSIQKKSTGEFYARYDAFAKAVDGGSGARYDEPEWDANGYLLKLVYDYYKQKGEWLQSKEFLFEIADFLFSKIDGTGLLFEGGIIEWRGYLPATNMNCAEGLRCASEIAKLFNDKERNKKYTAAYQMISANIYKMFDKNRNTYADIRFGKMKTSDGISAGKESLRDTLHMWNTSMNFGVLWGYPDHPEVKATNEFYKKETFKLGGGLQYFQSLDPNLAGYGGDVFFFCTAGAAQYEAMYGSKEQAENYIKWMITNSNTYGLMPERIYLNESDCSPASPLSWCCAEFAASLLLL